MVTAANCLNQYSNNSVHLKKRERFNPPCTDVLHLFAFGIFLIMWIGIAIYAHCAGVPFKYDSSYLKMKPDSILVDISASSLYQLSILSASFIGLAVSILGLYFMSARFYTKNLIEFAFIFMISVLAMISLNLIGICGYGSIPVITIIIVLCVFTIYTLKQAGFPALCTVVIQACQTVINLPSTVMVTAVTINLILLIALFTISVITNLTTIQEELEPSLIHSADIYLTPGIRRFGPPTYVIAMIMVFLSCSLWIMTVIYNFGRIALYGIFVKWYSALDKDTIPHSFIFRSMFTSLRYNFGTVIFGSTIFTIVNDLRATFNCRRELLSKFKDRPITIFCFLVLLANSTTNTLVACASNGTSFYRSTKDSFKLIMQNSLTFTATHIATEWIIFLGIVFISGLSLIAASSYIVENHVYYLPSVPYLSTYIIAIGSLWISLVFLVTLRVAMQACLYCYLEDLSLNAPGKKVSDGDVGEETVTEQA